MQRAKTTISPLQVEGTITPPAGDDACEYSMVLSIRNERGEEIARQVIGVGALASRRAAHVHAAGGDDRSHRRQGQAAALT